MSSRSSAVADPSSGTGSWRRRASGLWLTALALLEMVLTTRHLEKWAPSESYDNAVAVSQVTILGLAFLFFSLRTLKREHRLAWLTASFLLLDPVYFLYRGLSSGQYTTSSIAVAAGSMFIFSAASILFVPPWRQKHGAA